MKYIITEQQYRFLMEEEEPKILKLPTLDYFGSWEILQKFVEKKGNHPFIIEGDLDFALRWDGDLGNLLGVTGNLELYGTKIHTLGNLEYVKGKLDLTYAQRLKDLGKLKYVGGDLILTYASIEELGPYLEKVDRTLDLFESEVESLGNLKYVDNDLDLRDATKLETLGNLEYVGGDLYLGGSGIYDFGKLKYVGGSIRLFDTPILDRKGFDEMLNNIEIGGEIMLNER
jgi:hypothetical protein